MRRSRLGSREKWSAYAHDGEHGGAVSNRSSREPGEKGIDFLIFTVLPTTHTVSPNSTGYMGLGPDTPCGPSRLRGPTT
jgi:hypothetical protein